MVESRCGVRCNDCVRKEQVGCSGCTQMTHPFWGGVCAVKSCCEGRALEHCGQCVDFPCTVLEEMGKAEGFDPAPKIAQCRRWRAEELARR